MSKLEHNKQVEASNTGVKSAGEKTAAFFKGVGTWIVRLRKLILSVPIVWLSWYFARLSENTLPEVVGLDLQTTGEYAYYITREAAVNGPLAITAVCLLMMFLSRKTLYPWLVALFSMAVPVLIMLINIFPA